MIQEGAENASIGGGTGNTVGIRARSSWVGGGEQNLIQNAAWSSIGGGNGNVIQNSASYSTIAGGWTNKIQAATGATIAGGAGHRIFDNAHGATIAGGFGNIIDQGSQGACIAGGIGNSILLNSTNAAIGGGTKNTIAGANGGTIGGGELNSIGENDRGGTIAGGVGNKIDSTEGPLFGLVFTSVNTIAGGLYNTIGPATCATIAGGMENQISKLADYSTIGGGLQNEALGAHATIPGGYGNSATVEAFAAGFHAHAIHRGAFVWNSGNSQDLYSTTPYSVTFRAGGGYRFFTDGRESTGVSLESGEGSWTSLSDRNAKENFTPVDPQSVLAKVAALPLSTWNYKAQAATVRHLGPMAQDFKAAFGLGATDRGITGVDADGVALAAIQGLNQKVEAQNRKLAGENLELKQRLEAVEKLLENLQRGQR